MNFENSISQYYKLGNIIGIYSGFLLFFSIIYLIFLRNKFTYIYVLLGMFIIGTLYLIINRELKDGKHKATF